MVRTSIPTIGRCEGCGKIIAYIFPIHDCTPTALHLAAQAKAAQAQDKRTSRRLRAQG